MKICAIDDCEKKFYAKDYCKAHYTRLQKYGDPLGRYVPNRERTCEVEGCDLVVASSGLCNAHYQRQRNGSPNDRPVGRAWRQYPYEVVNARGYVDIVYGRSLSQRKPKHRAVMEDTLGRPLVAGESVHHINGDKTDNRPENLELWSTSQPYGQRVSDKIAWALKIIEEYGDNPSAF